MRSLMALSLERGGGGEEVVCELSRSLTLLPALQPPLASSRPLNPAPLWDPEQRLWEGLWPSPSRPPASWAHVLPCDSGGWRSHLEAVQHPPPSLPGCWPGSPTFSVGPGWPAMLCSPTEHTGFEPCFHSGKIWLVQGCGWPALARGPVPTEPLRAIGDLSSCWGRRPGQRSPGSGIHPRE